MMIEVNFCGSPRQKQKWETFNTEKFLSSFSLVISSLHFHVGMPSVFDSTCSSNEEVEPKGGKSIVQPKEEIKE